MTDIALASKECPINFDHNSLEHSTCPVETYRELRTKAPVAWTESNGGYWVISGHAELVEAAEHPEIFSSELKNYEVGEPQGGIFIPSEKAIVPMVPTEVDPPIWRDFRLVFAKQFSPAEVNKMKSMITRLTTKYIDRVIESGRCDMTLDIASPIPADGVLLLLGLDLDEWAGYGEPYHDALGYPPGSEKFQNAVAGLENTVIDLWGKYAETTAGKRIEAKSCTSAIGAVSRAHKLARPTVG